MGPLEEAERTKDKIQAAIMLLGFMAGGYYLGTLRRAPRSNPRALSAPRSNPHAPRRAGTRRRHGR
jgi:hypothetical protein